MTTYSSMILGDGAMAYYRLAEHSGNIAYDQTSNHYNGQIYGVTTGGVTLLQQNAIISDYLDFAMQFISATGATGGYILLPSGLKTDGLSDLSIECWFMLANNTFTSYPFLLANDSNPASSHVGFRLNLAPSTDGASGYFELGNGTTYGLKAFGSGVFSANVWYHLVATYNGSNIIIYVNGIPQGSSIALTGTVGTATHQIYIATNLTSNDFFNGMLDELAIYPVALTQTQVTNHYNTGAFGRCGLVPFPATTRRQS